MMKTPSEKQIKLADMIAEVLGVDFPQSSAEFTAQIYYEFIHSHIDKLMDFDEGYGYGFDDEMMWFSPLNQQ